MRFQDNSYDKTIDSGPTREKIEYILPSDSYCVLFDIPHFLSENKTYMDIDQRIDFPKILLKMVESLKSHIFEWCLGLNVNISKFYDY